MGFEVSDEYDDLQQTTLSTFSEVTKVVFDEKLSNLIHYSLKSPFIHYCWIHAFGMY